MKVLIIGSGGREHALAWKLKQSPLCTRLWCAPGNAGIAESAEIVNIGANSIPELTSFAKQATIDLVVIGPEAPLAEGLSDALRAEGIDVFGPSQAAARVESSKIFARRLMDKYRIPTPKFASFDAPEPAKAYVRKLAGEDIRSVIKADGLAAGKGAIVTSTPEEADEAIDLCMVEKKFGAAGTNIVIEERLSGPELSILAITDGKRIVILPPSQDHKPIGEGDTGLNTGGMGAYSPVPIVDNDLLDTIRRVVIEPAIRGMETEGCPYSGVLYAGLMLADEIPYVIEFNCRFGDPETQAVLPSFDEDLLPILRDAARGEIGEDRTIEASKNALCVVMASGGYPEAYEKGKPILGLDTVAGEMKKDAVVFHAGTSKKENEIITAGGRVLGVTGLGYNFDKAFKNAYRAVEKISFEGAYYRKDIGYRVRNGQ